MFCALRCVDYVALVSRKKKMKNILFGGRKRISFALISHVCPSTKHCKEYSRLMERNPFFCVCVLSRDCYFHSSVYCDDYKFLFDCNPPGDRGEAYWIYSRGFIVMKRENRKNLVSMKGYSQWCVRFSSSQSAMCLTQFSFPISLQSLFSISWK